MKKKEVKMLPRHLVEEGFAIMAREIEPGWCPWHLTIQVPRSQILTLAEQLLEYFHEIGIEEGKALLAFEYDRDRYHQPIFSRIHLHCLLYAPDYIIDLIAKAQTGKCKGIYKLTRAWDLLGLMNYFKKQLSLAVELPPLQILNFVNAEAKSFLTKPHANSDSEEVVQEAMELDRLALCRPEKPGRKLKNPKPLLWEKKPSALATAWEKILSLVVGIQKILRLLYPLPRDK